MENEKSDTDNVVNLENESGGSLKIPKSMFPENTEHGEKPDITFIFPANGGATISVEKKVLAGKSTVFKKQFISSKDSPEKERIPITDISFDIFNKLVKHMYGEKITVHEDNFLEILYAAKKYFVNDLIYMGIEFLEGFLNEENVDEHFEFIEKFDIKVLNDLMKTIIINDPLEVIRQMSNYPGTTTEPHKRILQIILEADSLPCTEFELYTAIRDCLITRNENTIQDGKFLRNELGKLIYLIRFPTMSISELIKCGKQPSPLEDREILDFLLWEEEKIFSDTLQFYSLEPRKTVD